MGEDGKYAVDLELRPITILVGKNGSGKSSVLEALGFLEDSLEGRSPSQAEMVRVPSYEALIHKSAKGSQAPAASPAQILVRVQQKAWRDAQDLLFEYTRTVNIGARDHEHYKTLSPQAPDQDCRPVLAQALRNVFLLSAARGHVPWPPVSQSEARWVGREAQHLDSVMRLIYSRGIHAERRRKIQIWCSVFGLENIYPDDYQDPELKVTLLPILASEGSRQAYALVVQIFWADSGATIMVEEPELSLHPSAQVDLCGLFAEAVRDGKQLIASTHSPFVLEGLAIPVQKGELDPQAVIIHELEKTGAGTRVAKTYELDEHGVMKGWVKSFALVEKEVGRAFSRSLPKA